MSWLRVRVFRQLATLKNSISSRREGTRRFGLSGNYLSFDVGHVSFAIDVISFRVSEQGLK